MMHHRAAPPQGQLLRWLNPDGIRTGTDPGGFDPAAVEQTVARAAHWFGPGRYFGLEVHGWESMPAAPALIVSNHSGGTTIPDVWGFGIAWYRRFGVARPLHPLAHEMVFSLPPLARFFARRGVLRADRRLAVEVLQNWRRDLMVMPGGDRDTWRPYTKRYEVCFGGRTGYARLALRTGVPVVPLANVGAHETLFVITDGRRAARALGLSRIARASVFPVHLSLPWGLAIGPWPHIPLPASLRYRIGAPIEVPTPPEPDYQPPPGDVRELDAEVRRAVQALLDEMRP
jgi:1-acyl-sn-glycerol-3-phosphate acyltransferase